MRRKIDMRGAAPLVLLTAMFCSPGFSEVTRLEIKTRTVLLDGRAFGAAGPYEKIAGTVHFALDPNATANHPIVDLPLASSADRDARGRVEFSADFYLLKPVEPERGNGVLFYEAGNRGRKRILATFQQASRSDDPTTADEFGNGSLMKQGYSLLWMGWQWDVPDGRMRMEMPIARQKNGAAITGLVRGNFIPGITKTRASLADRGHRGYAALDKDGSAGAEHVMTFRRLPHDPPRTIARDSWRFVGPFEVELDGGFEPGQIYDVVYRSQDPRILGTGLAGTRDLISFFKYDRSGSNPLAGGIEHAIGWGVSQTGRFLRHFVYEGFNADESGRIVFDGVFDQVGGAGRGSFNHRFGQASRDALQFFNIFYPVDQFPFTDAKQEDPVTGSSDSVLKKAVATGTVPKMFHLLTNSEYFNRAGSLVHTNTEGTKDIAPPASSRIYFVASAPHIVGSFPPGPFGNAEFRGQASMNPLRYEAVTRALFQSLSDWISDGRVPPPSRYPRLSDGTLTTPQQSAWPRFENVEIPTRPLTPHRLDFGPRFNDAGIVDNEPPKIGKAFTVLVPAVDETGNDRAGIRLPEIEVPLATHTGWNYRTEAVGSPDRLASEIGSYFPLAKTAAARAAANDSRESIAERYRDEYDYLGRITETALALVEARFLLAEDLPLVLERARTHYRWTVGHDRAR